MVYSMQQNNIPMAGRILKEKTKFVTNSGITNFQAIVRVGRKYLKNFMI